MLSIVRQLLALFERRERLRLAGLFGAIVVMAFVEVVGIAAIMPFMGLVADPGRIERSRTIHALYEGLGFTSHTSFLLAAGVGVLALLAFSNAYSAFTSWWVLRFIWAKHHELSRRLLEQYLRQPYSAFLNRNSADLSKNILSEVMTVMQGLLIPGMSALAKGMVALFIFGLLLAVDVGLALSVGAVLGGAYVLIYALVRRRLERTGRERLASTTMRFKVATEALGGVKDIKVLGREDAFVARFSEPSENFSRHSASYHMIAQLPRYAMELVAFGGIILIVLYLITQRQNLGEVLAVVSLYALAGYRLMPALQQVFNGLTAIRFNQAALAALHEDLQRTRLPEPADGAAPPARPVPLGFSESIGLGEVWYTYPGADTPALRGIGVEIPRNATVAFVGSTGAGKTTLVDVMLGLLPPDRGSLLADGRPVPAERLADWREGLGYVPQEIFLLDDTIARNIAFGIPPAEVDPAAVERAARVANLHDFVGTLPQGYETVVGERGVRLSGGQRQRIGIARALYRDPQVLVLDEATSALDGITEDAVMDAIYNLSHSKTIIMIAHRLTSVQHCDVIYLLDGGRIVEQGSYAELIGSSASFRAMAKVSA